MVFYRDLIRAALEIAPEQTVEAIAAEVLGFQMPGTGIPGFARKGVRIADAGIYDIRIHRDEVLMPVLRHWKVLDLTLRTEQAQRAQADLAAHLDVLEQLALRHEERRDARRERAAAKVTA
jgi:acyl-[acyl-carrier-protein] desaturase